MASPAELSHPRLPQSASDLWDVAQCRRGPGATTHTMPPGMPLPPAPWVPPANISQRVPYFLERQRCVSQPLSRCYSYVVMRSTTRGLATPESVEVQLIFSAFLTWAKICGCTFSRPVFFCSNLPMPQCFR